MNSESIALIGGGGFIGTNLAEYFSALDYNVLVVGRSIIENEYSQSGNIIKRLIDVNKTSKLVDVLEGYENIVWLVNDLVPASSMDTLTDDFHFNVAPLVNFLEAAKTLINLRRFYFISSGGTIYGNSAINIPINELCITNPISPYGLSKLVAEKYVSFITRKAQFQSIILRPSNVYGSHQNFKKPQGIIGYAFNAIINNSKIDIYGDGNVIRDFVHVLDLCNVIELSIHGNYEPSTVKTYNIGSQYGYSINEVLNLINEVSGGKIQVSYKPARSFDCNFNVLDISRVKYELGWRPQIDLKEGLLKVWSYINSKKKN